MAEVTNIFEFKRKPAAPSVPNSETVAAMQEARDIQHPRHAGYPEVAPPPTASIGDTAAVQVVKALQFYARSGFDHGEMARAALTGMATVIQAGEGVGPA